MPAGLTKEQVGISEYFSDMWQRGATKQAPIGVCLTALAQLLNRDLPANLDGYIAALSGMTADQFVRACSSSAEESEFFPTPGELRRYAGIPTGRVQADAEALQALRRVVEAIRKHGVALTPLPGKVLRDRDNDGRCLAVRDWAREAPEMPPAFGDRADEALLTLGHGDRAAGLQFVWPLAQLASSDDPKDLLFRQSQVGKIEQRWISAYQAVK